MNTAAKCAYCDPATSREAMVSLGEDLMGKYPARIMTNYRWNGWAVPAFDYQTALRVAADTHLLAAEHSDKGDTIEFASYDAGRDAFVMTGGGRSAGDEPFVVEVLPCCGRYDIGAMNWTWTEA